MAKLQIPKILRKAQRATPYLLAGTGIGLTGKVLLKDFSKLPENKKDNIIRDASIVIGSAGLGAGLMKLKYASLTKPEKVFMKIASKTTRLVS